MALQTNGQSTIEFDGELQAIPGYRVKGVLGRGGMATVYLAEQLNLCRDVALKVMSPQFAATPGFAARFLAEGRMTARLNHPNIVTIHDVGQHNGLYYLAAELLSGGTLKERIPKLPNLVEKLRVLRAVARGLGYAHGHKIIHRDVKPVNIMFRDETQPVVTDFGIAKSLDASHVFTQAGGVMGTPHYMSPEQAQGLALDGRSDLYALGIMMFEILVGKVPFDAPDALAILYMHVQEQPPELPAEYSALQPVLSRLVAKLPEQRFQSSAEFVAAIEGFLGKHSRPAHTSTPIFDAPESRKPKPQNSAHQRFFQVIAPVDLPLEPGWVASKDNSYLINIPGGSANTNARRRSKLPVVGLALGLASIGLTIALVLWIPELDPILPAPQTQPVLTVRTELLDAVRAHIARGRLLEPAGDSAIDLVGRILQEAPTDAMALALLKEIGIGLSVQVRERWHAGKRAEALMLLRMGLEKMPNDLELNRTRADLQLALDYEPPLVTSTPNTGTDVDELLQRAEELYAQSQWTAPQGDNAVEVLQRVLAFQPNQPKALELLAKIAGGYEKVAVTWRERGRPDQALVQVQNGLKAQPTNSRLLRLEQELRKF